MALESPTEVQTRRFTAAEVLQMVGTAATVASPAAPRTLDIRRLVVFMIIATPSSNSE